jgi:hypothetical protein
MTPPTTEQTGLTRRDILKRGAAFGGALMWATPVVQVVGMSPAHARPVSPGCIRYCIKWETDGNQRLLDTETGDHQLTCDDLVIWTSFWVGLGGSNADEPDQAAASTSAAQADESTTTSSTTSTTEAVTDTSVEEGHEEGADQEGGDSETESAPSVDTSESTGFETSTPSEVTQSQDNERGGPPEGTPGGGPPGGNPGPPGGNPGGPPEESRGNCIECDTSSSVNSDSAAQQVADNMGIEVYGDPITGFYISLPSDCGLADLDEEGLDSAAVKVGGQGGGDCSVVVSQEPDPCRSGYTRIVLPNPDMAHDISHIELIIDCCE